MIQQQIAILASDSFVAEFWNFYEAAQLAFDRSNAVARRLLLVSIIYLPSVFLLMLLDKN